MKIFSRLFQRPSPVPADVESKLKELAVHVASLEERLAAYCNITLLNAELLNDAQPDANSRQRDEKARNVDGIDQMRAFNRDAPERAKAILKLFGLQ